MVTFSVQPSRSILLLLAFAVLPTVLAAKSERPTVDEIAHGALRVTTSAGTGLLPIYVSSDWSKPQPRVTRAIVIFHGKKRNAAGYFRSTKEAAQSAGDAGRETIVIAPQFLAEEDAAAFH